MIAQALQVDENQMVPEDSFVQGLYTDSIWLVELLLRLEDEGVDIPFEEAWDIKPVENAYLLYTVHKVGHNNENLTP